LQDDDSGGMGFKACADKTAAAPRQAARKPTPEEDG
jgi:hypothetical protein